MVFAAHSWVEKECGQTALFILRCLKSILLYEGPHTVGDEMNTFKKETQDENDVVSEKNGANKTKIMATEAERQSGLDDTSVSKPEVSEPYIAYVYNYYFCNKEQ